MYQLPVLPPATYDCPLDTGNMADRVSARVLELTYTAWDIKAFAEDLDYHGPPFVWDEERRAQLRAQLDALYFHLYELTRDETDYIPETFPIVRRKDIEKHGEYRTKNLILRYYDAYAHGDFDVWFGPEELREPRVHPDNPPEGPL